MHESLAHVSPTTHSARSVSPAALWTGRVLSLLFALPLLAGGVMNILPWGGPTARAASTS